MCKHLLNITVKNTFPTKYFPQSMYSYYVPCGKCVDCLKRRQTDYSTRIYREARKGEKMFFVTLTYRNDELPIAKRLYLVDTDTGVLEPKSDFEIESDSELLASVRLELSRIPPSESARYIDKPVLEHDSLLYFARFTPSLNRLDVRMWLKKARIQYKRDFGMVLPTFSYAFCGEYGARGSRPHYHCLFFGLSNEQIEYLCKRWEASFGYTLTKEVPILNPDGSDARMIVSRYVGKYISKGKFDLDSVKCHDCEKGRLCNSLRLGSRFTDEEVAYYRCYDLYGKYEIDTLIKLDSFGNRIVDSENHYLHLDSSEIHAIALESMKRNSIQVSSLTCPMPKALKIHLWYYKINPKINCDEFEDKVFVRRSPILAEVETILRNKFASEGKRKYKALYPERDVSALCPEFFAEFFQFCKSTEKDTAEIKQEAEVQAAYYREQIDNQ